MKMSIEVIFGEFPQSSVWWEKSLSLISSTNGVRFGFVKFKDVKDPVELDGRLSDVWCGDRKLKVNLSRFGRDSKVVLEVRDEGRKVVVPATMVDKDVSFKHVLAIAKLKEVGEDMVVSELVIYPEVEVLDRLKECFVGYLHYPREAKLIQAGLFIQGIKGGYCFKYGRQYGVDAV